MAADPASSFPDPPWPAAGSPRRGLSRRQLTGAVGLGAVAAGVAAACGPLSASSGPVLAGPALTTVFGPPGSLGGLSGHPTTATVEVPGFRFGAGQAAFMSAVDRDGAVIIGTTPFSDDQSMPTSTDMELGVFDPSARTFTRMVIPTTTGRETAVSDGRAFRGLVGGADVSDVLVVRAPDGGQRVLFVSASPFHDWDAATTGLYPSFGQLLLQSDGWRYDRSLSWTADELAAKAEPWTASQAFPQVSPAPRSPRGPVSITRLPRSGHLVVAQYFGDQRGVTDNGALAVLDLDGRLRAWWQYPTVSPFGVSLVVSPREVAADPTSRPDDERFVLISDCRATNHVTQPFPIQEFSYSASSARITPKSCAVRAAQDGSRMETACFDSFGNLYVARTAADGLTAAALAVYPRLGDERSLVLRAPAIGDGAQSFGIECRPEFFVAGTDRGGLVRSLVLDPVTGAVLVVGLSGVLQAVRPAGLGARMSFPQPAVADLGLSRLRESSGRYIGVRRGAVDAARRVLWLPINQLVLDAIRWPYAPFPLDQWLARIDLRMLLGA
jgi:hypothetical protein